MEYYTYSYLRNHCVDFFFRLGNKSIHVLTDGCLIPQSLSNVIINRKLQHEVALLLDDVDAHDYSYSVNNDYIDLIQQTVVRMGEDYQKYVPSLEQLVESHASYSKLGFYSYACVWNNEEETDCRFVLVTSPAGLHRDHTFELPTCSEQEIQMEEARKELRWKPHL